MLMENNGFLGETSHHSPSWEEPVCHRNLVCQSPDTLVKTTHDNMITTHDKEAFWLAGGDHEPLLLTTK